MTAPATVIEAEARLPPIVAPTRRPTAPAFALRDVAAIFAPLPPVPWLVQGLDVCPGAPMLIAGYGYSGKTAAAQALAFAIATGRPAWGAFSVRQGRAVHVDYEQGWRLTAERYQRLAAGALVTPDELGDRLALVSMPQLYIDAPAAEDGLVRACDGAALLIVDSLRAAAPSVDENSSEVRRPLDMLTRVSERTGCVPLVLLHARKPQQDAAGGARASIRGSGALYDACASALVFEGAKGSPTRVTHEKARVTGQTADDFLLTICDVEIDGNPRGGLDVSARGVNAATTSAPLAAALPRVLAVVQAHDGVTITRLREECRPLRNPIVDSALEALIEAGSVVDASGGGRGSPRRYIAAGGPT